MWDLNPVKLFRLVYSIDRLKNKNIDRLADLINGVDVVGDVDFHEYGFPDFSLFKGKTYSRENLCQLFAWMYAIERAVYAYKTLVPHVPPQMTADGLMLVVNLLQTGRIRVGYLSEVPASFALKRDGWILRVDNSKYVYMDKNPEVFFGKALWKRLSKEEYKNPPDENCCDVVDHWEDVDLEHESKHYILGSRCPSCNALTGYAFERCRVCLAAKHAEDLLMEVAKKQTKKKKRKARKPLEPLSFEINADPETLCALGFVL